MKTLPKRALLAATLATALVGVSATAIVQASVLQPAAASAGEAPVITVVAQADKAPDRSAAKPAAERHEQRRAEHMAQMQKKMAERQADFKAKLQLTPEQEPAWNAFAARTQPAARPAQQPISREDWSKLTTPERLDRMQALRTERDARMTQRAEAIKSFYAVLDPAQRKVFDETQARGFQRTGMPHRGHHHGPRHFKGKDRVQG